MKRFIARLSRRSVTAGVLIALVLSAVALPASTSAEKPTHKVHEMKPADGVGDSPIVP